jgi:hypothetical protein
MREKDTSQRPCGKSDSKHPEYRDSASHRTQAWKEQLLERQRREEAIDDEVVPLERRAEKA